MRCWLRAEIAKCAAPPDGIFHPAYHARVLQRFCLLSMYAFRSAAVSNGPAVWSALRFNSTLISIYRRDFLYRALCLRNVALMEFRQHKSQREITRKQRCRLRLELQLQTCWIHNSHIQINIWTLELAHTRIRTHAFINIILIVCLKQRVAQLTRTNKAACANVIYACAQMFSSPFAHQSLYMCVLVGKLLYIYAMYIDWCTEGCMAQNISTGESLAAYATTWM